MRIPSIKECFEIICRMQMMDHIVLHSIQVCRVATTLVDHIDTGGTLLNRDMVMASALLHDITKTRSFKTRENHALTGCEFLSGIGYPEIGRVVGQHVRLDVYAGDGAPAEAEVVNYADKRVLHDKVVPLRERMLYVLNNYGREPEFRPRIRRLWQETERLEEKLFSYMSFLPEELEDRIDSDDPSIAYTAYRKICRAPY